MKKGEGTPPKGTAPLPVVVPGKRKKRPPVADHTKRLWAVKWMKIKHLKFWPRNARVHSEQEVSALVKSIEAYGWTNPVLIQEHTNYVIAGEGRIEAAKKKGEAMVPVLSLKIDEKKAREYRIADNQLAALATWDGTELAKEIRDLQETGGSLAALGFSDGELKGLLDAGQNFLDNAAGRTAEQDRTDEDPAAQRADGFFTFSVALDKEQHEMIQRAIAHRRKASIQHEDEALTTPQALTALCEDYLTSNA